MPVKTDTNKIIQSLWIGESLSTMEHLCIQSFLQNEHDFHLYAYQDIKNVPKNTTVLDANSIIHANKIFIDSKGGIASFSDWFRYKLLYEKGGWWVDMDSVCLRHFDMKEEYCFSTEHGHENDKIVNIGFIKSPAKAAILADCLTHIDNLDHNCIKWGELGPSLFNKIIKSYDTESYIMAPETFCPINWTDVYKLISKQNYSLTEKNFALHLWNEIWRIGYLDKDAIYHPESIYEQLKKKYAITI
ncbi:alpha 1,4-glycosyltransferase [Chitinophaga niastensis]|uniref:Alpha 1,4-glycosyltransferase n=1 Tax=Chitinophaga niastensis TaxID=536980 RepID=A0A2P8HQ09_CHINA|nr:glycosyltransferase [Chitinophaga niastensis]PSL48295.1 alpha 1,4-glycosyltransferase [Chitinophaga niastensis]